MIMQILMAGLVFGAVSSVEGSGDRPEREVFPVEFKWVKTPVPKRQIFPIEINWVEIPVLMKPWQIEFRFYQYHRGSPLKKIIELPEALAAPAPITTTSQPPSGMMILSEICAAKDRAPRIGSWRAVFSSWMNEPENCCK